MQTRKRAKSVSFGRKDKEEKKEIPEKKVFSEETNKSSEKAEVVERRVVPDKPQSDELSDTLPDPVDEPSASDVATPTTEFVTDNPSEAAEEEHTPEVSHVEEPAPTVTPVSSELSQPVETVAPSAVSPETPPPAGSHELSSTLPPSAFTIQNEENESQSPPPEEGKKRFGVYFFVVAFLSFILGLGAMAAASYFGVINLSLPKLPVVSSVHLPSFLGAKPTPTSAPTPIPSPTAKPVDLQSVSIDILNGSGVSGEAGKVKTSLTTDKFNVTSTGNADNNNYTKTVIAAKKTVDPAYLTQLKTELKKTFDVDTTVASLPSSATTDVTVTLGSSTAQ